MASTDPAVIRQQIEARLAALRARGYAELSVLPPHATEQVRFGPRLFSFTTYCDREPGGLRVVVQALPSDAGVVWAEAQAAGFRRAPSGATAPVPARELYAFV